MRRGLLALALLLVGPSAGAAQAPESDSAAALGPVDAQEEARLLREAAGLEWRGRPDEAVRTLEGLLGRKPASAGGLFALERVLRAVGRVGDVLPHADRFLAVEPGAPGPHAMKLRVLAEIDSLAGLRPAAEAWFAGERGSPDPYREVARIFRGSLGEDAALEVLREGRSTLGGDALALETGDLLAATGEERDAAEEWARALESPAADVEGILRRLDALRGDRARLAGPLIDALLGAPATVERREAAVRTALTVAPASARAVAERGLDDLGGGEAPRYLDAVAHHATEAGAPAVAYWALERIRAGTRGQPAAALDARLAAAALAAGDTTKALDAWTALARDLPEGSPERRRVLADLIRVEAHTAEAAAVERRLADFRREFPDEPGADDLTAAAAAALATRGQGEAALQVAGQVEGPRAQLERAWLLFEEARTAEGRDALEAALPALAPTAATEVVQLLAQLDRVGPAAGAALALATARAHKGRPAEALEGLEAAAEEAPDGDRPPLHARASQLALAAGDTARAEAHLRRVVEEHEDSAEAPEALFVLARIRAAAPEGVAEARELLERLILERPQAAVVPAARRELQRIGRGG